MIILSIIFITSSTLLFSVRGNTVSDSIWLLKYASSISLVTGQDVDENLVLCKTLKEIEKCVCFENFLETIEEYKKECITLGKRVRVLYAKSDESKTGLCTKIENDGSLTIETDNGETINVNSGEVSVRGIYGENYV